MRRLLALVVPLLLIVASGALAQGSAKPPQAAPSSADIVDKLTPPPPGGKPRSLTRGRVTIEGPPTIDMRIQFEIDSSKLDFVGMAMVDKLGVALADPRLGSYRFEIAGHSDASGEKDYNLRLSTQRANAVRDYLISKFKIAPDRLTAIGYGSDKPLNTADPNDAANRRVQITNIGR
jgi:outer membrane protein OmpA-like peptidoglycan-associated protein